ncbi:hypothetical protein LCGC14_0736010 [marine sediment metagenome]|uniref:AP2/ERF domain-containing protein n=1 Tax=marine sediment metagenome TaxID=412755 RepID=A0A0F9QCA9_9ZZZZ
MRFQKWMRGYYRLSADTQFAGIRRDRDGWHVEIRDSATGTLQRYAGIWPTLREARDEAEHVLSTAEAETFFDRRFEARLIPWPERQARGY